MKRLLCIMLFCSLLGCNRDDDNNDSPILNESDRFEVCNRIMMDCRNVNTGFCLNGFKWGINNPLLDAGPNVDGPKESGGVVTYSFQEENGVVNTHAQINLPSRSFDNLPSCAKAEIRNALNAWAEEANIAFEELPENSDSDIRFFVADIRQSGVGFPNFPDTPCDVMGGDLVIQTNIWTSDCDLLYNFFLHEIGHVLGLGHVGSSNIMNADFDVVEGLDGLQAGDIEGIVELYGEN
ncbi:MAG: matrixin family metalloprotease [Bacteroidota bacterium]